MTLADGRELGFTDGGRGDGPVVVYLHGAPGSRLDVTSIQAASWDEGVRVVALDRPGYGTSSAQPGRTLDQHPRDVAALADHLGIDRFAVVGLSSGGPYAVACAALLPDRVIGCGVVSGVTDMGWSPARDGYDPNEIELMQCASESAAAAWAVQHYGDDGAGLLTDNSFEWPAPDTAFFGEPTTGPAWFESCIDALRQGVEGYAQDVWVQGRRWPFAPADVACPTVVLHGADDTIVPLHAEHTASAIPGAALEVLPGHGHVSILTEVPALARRLLASE
jgi:pimeloyl-ACP methyl ester carboxylesterase